LQIKWRGFLDAMWRKGGAKIGIPAEALGYRRQNHLCRSLSGNRQAHVPTDDLETSIGRSDKRRSDFKWAALKTTSLLFGSGGNKLR